MLDANQLDDITTTPRISKVVLGGNHVDRIVSRPRLPGHAKEKRAGDDGKTSVRRAKLIFNNVDASSKVGATLR